MYQDKKNASKIRFFTLKIELFLLLLANAIQLVFKNILFCCLGRNLSISETTFFIFQR
jgi:hypothetical protein